MQDIYDVLQSLGITYETYEHPAVFTAEEAMMHFRGVDSGQCKNLFLRNAKGDKHYLVLIESTKRLDLQGLSQILGESKLSFASEERLLKYLGLTPGSVGPFGLINNVDKSVQVIVDNGLLKYEKLGFHPNTNTVTLVITKEDLKKFLEWTGNIVRFINL